MASYAQDKNQLLTRLRRIEGQVRGLQKMIDEEKYCVDVLTQVSSVMAALQKVGVLVLEHHIQGCVRNAIVKGEDEERAVRELIEVVERFAKAGPVASCPAVPAASAEAGLGEVSPEALGAICP